jgi:small subunit ribosomal protein S3
VGQKVHPGGFRLGILHPWKSNWFTERDFAAFLDEDRAVREHILKRLSHAGLSDIRLRKDANKLTVDIFTARPGIVIGKSGQEVDALRKDLHKLTDKQIQVNINEIKRPELDAKLVAQSIAEQLENRVSFRRAMKRALTSAMRSGAQGAKIQCGGRLGGGEMSRVEHYADGRVPLHTLRADIDYGFHEAKTTFGRIGVKVWINKGEVLPEGVTDTRGRSSEFETEQPPRRPRRRRPERNERGGGAPSGAPAPAPAAPVAATPAPVAPPAAAPAPAPAPVAEAPVAVAPVAPAAPEGDA